MSVSGPPFPRAPHHAEGGASLARERMLHRLGRPAGPTLDPLGDELAEPVLLDLAARGHRELRDDLEALWELVARDLVALEEDGDLGERQRLALVRDHDGAGALHEPGVDRKS